MSKLFSGGDDKNFWGGLREKYAECFSSLRVVYKFNNTEERQVKEAIEGFRDHVLGWLENKFSSDVAREWMNSLRMKTGRGESIEGDVQKLLDQYSQEINKDRDDGLERAGEKHEWQPATSKAFREMASKLSEQIVGDVANFIKEESRKPVVQKEWGSFQKQKQPDSKNVEMEREDALNKPMENRGLLRTAASRVERAPEESKNRQQLQNNLFDNHASSEKSVGQEADFVKMQLIRVIGVKLDKLKEQWRKDKPDSDSEKLHLAKNTVLRAALAVLNNNSDATMAELQKAKEKNPLYAKGLFKRETEKLVAKVERWSNGQVKLNINPKLEPESQDPGRGGFGMSR